MVSVGPVATTTAYLSLSAKARKILGHKLMTNSLPVDRAPKHLASKEPLTWGSYMNPVVTVPKAAYTIFLPLGHKLMTNSLP